MAVYTLLANTAGASPTTAIDTTGSTLIVLACAGTSLLNFPSDSEGNLWLSDNNGINNGSDAIELFFCLNPVTSASHTFTFASGFPALAVLAFTGDPSNPTQQASATGSGNVALGSVTPAANDALLVTGFCSGNNVTQTIDAGFTITDQFGGVSTQRVAAAYLIQTSAAAVSPTWSAISGANAAKLLVFPLGTSGGGGGETAYAFAG